MKSYSQCYSCQWEYILFFLDFTSDKMIEVEGERYCPLCNPNQDEEDKLISDSRRELGRVYHMLDEQPTPEQIEIEILRERDLIVNMTLEELERHIDELDKLYQTLQIEAKKVKVKSIASLEVKRTRSPLKKEKKNKDENDEEKAIERMNALIANVKAKSVKRETQTEKGEQ